jgi:hypothetical protein
MKVYFSNYRNHWISPYTILEKIFFWREIDYDEPIIEKWSNRLMPLSNAYMKFMDFIHPHIRYVKLDRWDTWNMDGTLSPIILPMLKQLHATKHGSPNVDDADVPEELKSTSAPPKENVYDIDANHFKRFDWVMDEMIWAFEQLQPDNDWEEQYTSGVCDWKFVPVDAEGNEVSKGEQRYSEMRHGPNHTYEIDWEGRNKHQERITNGLRLFGKYYQSLWD